MKKIILSIAFLVGACVITNVQALNVKSTDKSALPVQDTVTKDTTSFVSVMLAASDDGYKEVKLDSLNADVQTAIKKYTPTHMVKNVYYNSAKQLTKVVFVSNADKKEKIVIFNKEGKEETGKA